MKLSALLTLFVLVVSCSQADPKKGKKSEEEVFPKVDLKRFDKVRSDGFEVLVLKDLTSVTNVSGNTVMEYNNLALEQHVTIKREKKHSSFKSFAEDSFKKFQGAFKKSSRAELIASEVNGLKCYRAQFEANSYGFPKRKSIWVRYYETRKEFYSVICWTVEEEKSKFAKEALVAGLSFKAK